MSTDESVARSTSSARAASPSDPKNGRLCRWPSFQFYPGDFWSSWKVKAMDASGVGMYLALLSESWMSCGLPDEGPLYTAMAKDLSVTVQQLLSIRQQMFTRDEHGVWTNARQERERVRAEQVSAVRAAAGRAAHKPKKGVSHAKARRVQAIAEQMSTPNPTQPNPAQLNSEEKNTPQPPAGESIQDPKARQAFEDWKAHKGRKFTPIVATKTRKRLEEWGVERFAAAVDFSITNAYTGLFEPGQNGSASSPRTAYEVSDSDLRQTMLNILRTESLGVIKTQVEYLRRGGFSDERIREEMRRSGVKDEIVSRVGSGAHNGAVKVIA